MEESCAKTPEICCERRSELRVFGGVFGRQARDAAGGLGVIVVEQQRLAIQAGREDARIGAKNFAIEFFDLQVARNVGPQRTEGVGQRRGAEAGVKFFRDGAAADYFAAFENEGLESAFGEIKRGDEGIVTAADENYALSDGHGQLDSLAERAAVDATGSGSKRRAIVVPLDCRGAADFFHSFRMTWLAMRPLAPMMPPPGCVADPHI